jgi:hypothetical protein
MHAVKFRADENMHIARFPFVEGKNYEKGDSVNSFSDQCLIVLQGRCGGDGYMGGRVREEWDETGLACARLQNRADPGSCHQVNSFSYNFFACGGGASHIVNLPLLQLLCCIFI